MRTGKTPVPSYYEIIKYFEGQVGNGNLKPGDQLPSEREMLEKFGVSRITIRQAMDRLTFSKLIIKKRSKGTFISDLARTRSTVVLSGQINSIVEEAKQYDIKVLSKEVVPALSPKVRRSFGLSSEDCVCRIKRIRLMNGIPFSYVVNYVPVNIGHGITVEELQKSPLLELMRDKFAIIPEKGEETIEARNALEVSEILEIDTFDPVLFMEIIYRSKGGEVVDLVEHYYRGDCYKYRVNLL